MNLIRTISLPVLLGFSSLAYSGPYSIYDLGALGTGTTSIGFGLNNLNQVVGFSENSGDGGTRAILWDAGPMQALGPTGTSAYSINDSGLIVGEAIDQYDINHAVSWQSGTMQTLSMFPSTAYGVNNAGQIVGETVGIGVSFNAFFWNNGAMQLLGTLGGSTSGARDINANQQIVGWASYFSTYRYHAFLWENGVMQDLGTLGGNGNSIAYAINDSGQIVGAAYAPNNEFNAFLWSNGVMQNLGTFGQLGSAAFDINAYGQVVGTVSNLHAILWQNGSTIFDLCDLTDCVASGWDYLISANAINDQGSITGYGITANGEKHAFLIQASPVPLPPAFWMLSSGLVVMIGVARRKKKMH